MFQSIYKRIRIDFEFLETDYGYQFCSIEHHNVMPSILYVKDNEKYDLQIGMHYGDGKMFVIFYENNQLTGNNILEKIDLNGRKYKEQVDQVKILLRKYLDN